ncbi:MAG: hybrid sensor histidine kinase/response regulator [Polyangia bacterium]
MPSSLPPTPVAATQPGDGPGREPSGKTPREAVGWGETPRDGASPGASPGSDSQRPGQGQRPGPASGTTPMRSSAAVALSSDSIAALSADAVPALSVSTMPSVQAEPSSHLIYLVDEDPAEVLRIVSVLRALPGSTVRSFGQAGEALAALYRESPPPVLLIIDEQCEQRLRDAEGVSLLATARREFPDTVRVLLTAHADKRVMVRALNEGGVFQFVEKPWDREHILVVVRNAIERGDLVATLRRTVAAMQQNNEALSAALQQIQATNERLVESERMAAVGRVASGIAHEIGNQLSVLSYAELIRDRYPDDAEIRLFTGAILSARARLGGLVGEIRDFSRVHGTLPRSGGPAQASQPAIELTPEEVVLSVQEALSILRFDPVFRLRTVERDLDCGARARVNRDKLVQVVLNLLRNALDATPPGGAIYIRVTADPISGGDGHARDGRPGGLGFVRILIDDHGEGIPADILPRIFEPFFTTKGDRGTGLGLGICKSIIAQHGGQLLVESPLPERSVADGPGRKARPGTRVTVALPRVP